MPDNRIGVTEEMVAELQRVIYGVGHQPDQVPRLCRRALEAAQAVAPPKETADTKRPAFGTVRRVTANPESPIECVVVGDDVMLDSEWPPASRTRVRLVYPAASSPAAPPKEREQETRDVGEAISALWTRIEARFWKGHEEGCAGRWDGEGEFDGCNCGHDSAASALEELAELAAASSPAAPATPTLLDQPTPTAYRHKNQLTGQWIYTESRCPSEWAERDGIVQEPLYLSGAAPATAEPIPDGLPEVGGESMTRTLNAFVQSCRVLLRDEQEKIAPDSALIGTLCDAVRLSREHARAMTAPLASSPAGASGTEEGIRQAERDELFALIDEYRSPLEIADDILAAGFKKSAPAGEEPDWRADANFLRGLPLASGCAPDVQVTLDALADRLAALHSRSLEKSHD